MANRTKEKQISVRLSEEELQKLKANIEDLGLNQRDYIAGCILNDSENISLKKEIDTARARISELEYLLQEAFQNLEKTDTKYDSLKNEYDDLKRAVCNSQQQVEEYKRRFDEKKQYYANLLDLAEKQENELKKQIAEKNKKIEHTEHILKSSNIKISISLLYAVIISIIAIIQHFDVFSL